MTVENRQIGVAVGSGRKRHVSTDEAIARLRRIEEAVKSGENIGAACRRNGVAVPTYYRWQRKYATELALAGDDLHGTRRAIVTAAKKLFFDQGLAATLEAIAIEANVARQTVYNQFGSKQALFKEVVLEIHGRLTADVVTIDEGADLRDTLLNYGHRIAKSALDQEAIDVFRVAIAEFRHLPNLGRMSFELRESQVLPKLTTHLSAYLAQHLPPGRADCDEANLLAELFYGAIVGFDRNRMLAGVSGGTQQWVDRRVVMAADLIVARVGESVPRHPQGDDQA